ncbi:MAG: WbqC family protein [Thermaurantimonas sp.]|uniref:WbqC family protein n=1 Tax=Thermaurantimonas sp. TaxID=2681568 RepID=UPI00391CC9D0
MPTNTIGFPPFLFPSTSWFSKWLKNTDKCIVTDWPWQKQSAFNRFYIDGPNGQQILTIPVKHPERDSLVSQIQISYHIDWPSLHLKTLHSTYNNSPFYEFLQNNLADLYKNRPVYLIEFVLLSIDLCLYWLKEKKTEKCDQKTSQLLQLTDIELKKGFFADERTKEYTQVFSYKNGFLPNVSCMDLIFNEGQLAKAHLIDL